MAIRKRFLTLGDVLTGIWLMHPKVAQGYYPHVFRMLSGEVADLSVDRTDTIENTSFLIPRNSGSGPKNLSAYFISDYGEAAAPEKAPENSVAVISIKGVMTKQDQYCGPAGTDTKKDLLQRCLNNSNIIGVVLDFDSGGGQSNEDFNAEIANATKPVVASVGGWCCSAAYWAASNCNEIFVSGKMSVTGSIGSYIEVADFTRFYEEAGIDIIRVYAPQSTLKNKAYEDLLKGNQTAMKSDLKKYTDFFIEAVQEARPNINDDGKVFKGQCYFSEEAIANGLADTQGNLKDAIMRVEELANAKNPPAVNNAAPNNTNNSNQNKMFSRFPKLSALKNKKADEITEEMINAANAELVVNGITGMSLVFESEVSDAEKTILTLTNEKTALTAQVATLTTENTKLKKQDGADPVTVNKDKDEQVETAEEKSAKIIADLPHNKKAAEILGQ